MDLLEAFASSFSLGKNEILSPEDQLLERVI